MIDSDDLMPLDEALRWMRDPTSFTSPGAREAGRSLVAYLQLYRNRVTTGGPPPPVTPNWENGFSSRPSTAPPEPKVVELPDARSA